MAAKPPRCLNDLLREVSRSFYLTLRALPARIRAQIGLAYLLARATDTIADTETLPLADRLLALDHLRTRILGKTTPPLDFTLLIASNPSAAASPEQILLARVEEIVQTLRSFAPADQDRIRRVLATITSGQELDLQRFAGASEQRIVSLQTDEDLDDYTYRVAGCVGEFWTEISRAHLFPTARLEDRWLLAQGVRFGKGLQLVNILRDLPADLRLGRCYVPAGRLAACGLKPSDLLDRGRAPQFQTLFHSYLGLAEAHLSAGWAYTNALPFRQVRLRLACAWPLLIGLATLKELRFANMLDASIRIKISRGDVRKIIVQSILWYPWRPKWRALFRPASS